jgi:hypothetical protein
MDIHRPNPVHGWRDFAKEVGIIVLGVLIALGAEQGVEWLHWRHEVEIQRAALREEALQNLTAAAYRLAEQPCIEKRLAELEEGFRRQEKGVAIGFRHPLERPPIWVASTGTWEIAVSGQALDHMPHKEKLSFSDAFDSYKAFAQLRNDEDAVWRRLALINHGDILSAGDWVELHQAWGQAMGTNERMKSLMTYVTRSANLGQRPLPFEAVDLGPLRAFCTSLYP